jgi:hypothetical protein
MIKHNKMGGRTIELFIPFEFNKKQYDAITFGPLKLGHVMLWNEGHWPSMLEFMAELADIEVTILRELRYPDADRVTETFMSMLTPEIRNDVEVGRVPQKPIEEKPPIVTNGSGAEMDAETASMLAPGVPLPPEMMQPGFDLSEEP